MEVREVDGEENRRGSTPSEEQRGRAVEPPRLARPPCTQRTTTSQEDRRSNDGTPRRVAVCLSINRAGGEGGEEADDG